MDFCKCILIDLCVIVVLSFTGWVDALNIYVSNCSTTVYFKGLDRNSIIIWYNGTQLTPMPHSPCFVKVVNYDGPNDKSRICATLYAGYVGQPPIRCSNFIDKFSLYFNYGADVRTCTEISGPGICVYSREVIAEFRSWNTSKIGLFQFELYRTDDISYLNPDWHGSSDNGLSSTVVIILVVGAILVCIPGVYSLRKVFKKRNRDGPQQFTNRQSALAHQHFSVPPNEDPSELPNISNADPPSYTEIMADEGQASDDSDKERYNGVAENEQEMVENNTVPSAPPLVGNDSIPEEPPPPYPGI